MLLSDFKSKTTEHHKMYKYYVVYEIVCSKNGKRYIGRSKTPYWRVVSHLKALRNNRHNVADFQNDYNQYGPEKFEVNYLYECNSDRDRIKEQDFQREYQSYVREYGYNYEDPYWRNTHANNLHRECAKE